MPFGVNDKVYVEPFGKSDVVHPDSQGAYQQMYGVIPGQEGEEGRVRQLKAQRAAEPLGDKIARIGTGVGEAALSTATGLLAPLQAIPAAALKSALGMVPDAEKEAARLMEEKTYQPRSETGQDYTGEVGKVLNEFMALGPGNLSGLVRPRPGALTKRAPGVAEVPKTAEVPVKPWDKMTTQERIDAVKKEETPPTTDAFGGVNQFFVDDAHAALNDKSGKLTGKPINPFNLENTKWKTDENGMPVSEQVGATQQRLDAEQAHIEAQQAAMAAQQTSHLNAVDVLQRRKQLQDAQAAIEARQAALELEVKKATTQSFNAAERARQEAAPTGFENWRDTQRMEAEKRLPGDNTPLDFTNEVPQPYPIPLDRGQGTGFGQHIPSKRAGYSEFEKPYTMGESPKSIDGLDYTQHRAEMLSRGIDKLEDINKAWDIRRTEQLSEDTIQRIKDERTLGQEQGLTALEQQLREGAYKPTGDGQGPKTRNAIAMRSQRGSSQMLTDIAHGIVNSVRAVKNATHTAAEYIATLPGLRKEADALITKPLPAKDLLEKARSEGDGPKLWNNAQSGLALAKDKLRSTMVSNASEWFNWSNARGNYIVRKAVYPLEKTFAKLGTKNLVDLLSIVHSEMMQRREFTAEQLARITDNPKILEAREAFKKVWDVLFEEQNAQRDREGKPRITRLEAYMSSIFRGDYHVPLYAKNGSLIGYFQTTTKGGAKNAIAWIKEHYKDHPDVDVSGLKYDHSKMYQPGGKFGNAPRDVLSSWKDIADALGDSPLAAEFKQAMEQWVAQKGTHAFAQDLHHVENKANVRGFEGDQPWLGANKNAHNWAKAQIQNMQEAVHWSTAQEAISHVKEYLTDPIIQKNQENNVALTKAYMLDHMGSVDNIFRKFENVVAGGFGVSRSTLKAATDLLKAGIYFKTLFGSAPYMVATPVQALWTSSMWFHREFSEGNVKIKPVQFMGDLMDSMLGSTIPRTDIKIPKISKDSNAKLKWAEDNGYIHNILHEEGASIGAHKGVDAAMDFSNQVISAPDNWVRRVIFLPFANALEASGKYATKEAALRRAGEITDNIAVSMRAQDKPLWIKKMGIAGDLIYIFHAPVANMYNNLAAMNKYRKQTGNWGPLATGWGMLALVGGLTNLPGAKETLAGVDMMQNMVAEYLPEHYNTFDPRVALLKLMPDVQVLGHSFGEHLSAGVASTVTGMDLRSRLSNEVIDAEQPIKSVLPGVGVYGDVLKSTGKFIANPTEQTSVQLAKDLVPGPTLRGIMETNLPQFKTQNQPGADKGITSYRNPNDLDNPNAFVRRNADEVKYKTLGATALTEGLRREKDARWNAEVKRQTTARDGIADKIFKDVANSRVDDKVLASNIAKYVQLNGDTKTLQTSLESKFKDMPFTKVENATNKMKGYTKVMDVLQRLNMDHPVTQ
jgi:hypothetical protein